MPLAFVRECADCVIVVRNDNMLQAVFPGYNQAAWVRQLVSDRRAMTILYTIGYEGLVVEELVALLKAHGVAQVLDVRKLPLSRRRGFSKTALGEALRETNIAYMHIAALGTPKELRDAVKKTRDYDTFFAAMKQQIVAQPEALTQALALVRAKPCALLCVEAAPEHCHRLTVAEQLNAYANGTLVIEHILR